jgi:hypothetical protein
MKRDNQVITYPDDPSLKRESALHRLSMSAVAALQFKLIISPTISSCRVAL